MAQNSHANAGDSRDVSLIPELGKSAGVGNGNLLQYSCLGNSMERGAWWTTCSPWCRKGTHHGQKSVILGLNY